MAFELPSGSIPGLHNTFRTEFVISLSWDILFETLKKVEKSPNHYITQKTRIY